ncbi:jun-like transcription factor [Coemansia guatemalensis]|uniref:Jun-like transcription factor n=1 Tax=Coemansia guatemalensis TaxID=2761395 RepID=A0A9W8HRZ8_9FUNG|nr:jun-like transcription factor [Coemansia guatemalensis]
MARDAARHLAEIQSLLTECGMERTTTVLIAEAAQVGKRNKTVQAFLELAVAQEAIKRTRDQGNRPASPTLRNVDVADSESGSSQSYKSANEEPASSTSSKALSASASSKSSESSGSGSTSSSNSLSDSAESTDSSSSSSSEDDASSVSNASVASSPPSKKSRLSQDASLKTKINNQIAKSMSASPKGKAQINQQRGRRGRADNTPATPFCRIRPEEVVYADERLKDNTYLSKGETIGDFGYKAHKDLIVTRGKAFTKEKNKKKRGSYSGGRITMTSHSIKFT